MKSKISIKTSVELAIAHRLNQHEGKCKRLHGHNYIFEVEVAPRNGLNEQGMVMDFSEVKDILKSEISDVFDHKTLVTIASTARLPQPYCWAGSEEIQIPHPSTAERLLLLFVALVDARLDQVGCSVVCARLSETANCSAIYRL